MTGLFIIALGLTVLTVSTLALAVGIAVRALIEEFRLVRSWRKDHGR